MTTLTLLPTPTSHKQKSDAEQDVKPPAQPPTDAHMCAGAGTCSHRMPPQHMLALYGPPDTSSPIFRPQPHQQSTPIHPHLCTQQSHAHKRACAHAHVHACAGTSTHAQPAHTHTNKLTPSHTCTHAYAGKSTRAQLAHTHTSLHSHTHARMRSQEHACKASTHVHTRTTGLGSNSSQFQTMHGSPLSSS